MINSMTYAFIKSVQHDLQRLSCLEPGESNATGSIDNKTKRAVMQFRYIVDLPSQSWYMEYLWSRWSH